MTPVIGSIALFRTALIASLFALVAASTAMALEAGKDWTNTEEVDAILATPVCRAQTIIAQSTVPIELSFAYPKDPTIIPIVYVKTMGLEAAASTAQIRFAKKEFQPMFLYKKAASPQEPDIYWYAPKDLPRLLDLISAGATLDLVLNPKAEKPVPVRVSLRGSAASVRDAQKCALSKQLLPAEFLKFLNTKITIEGEIPAGVTAAELQALVQKSYRDYLAGKEFAASLAKLRQAMKPLTSKESVALKDLSYKQGALDKTTKQLNERQAEFKRLNDEIAQFEKELAQAKIDKPIAEQDLATKKAAYDPLKAQMAPFEKDVADKTKLLKSAKSAVARGHERISSAQNDISYLKNRASSLRSAIPGLRSDVSSAESDVSRARSNLNSFSYSRERDSYMWRHGYSSAKSDAERYEREASRYEGEAQSAQSELSRAQSALSTCKAKPNANCSSEESAVSSAQSRYSSAQSSASSARSQASSARSRADSIENAAESHARSMENELESALRRAQSELSSAESALSSAENELSSIVNHRLPSAQNELARARAALPGLQQAQADAEAALAVSQQAMADKRKAIGIDPVEQAYHAAIEHLAKLVKLIADRTAGIAKNTKAAAKLPPVIAKLAAQVAKETKIRDESQAKLTVIQTALAPQRAQEAAVVAQLDSAKASLAKGRNVYQAVYAQLSAVPFEESAAPLMDELGTQELETEL